MTKRFITSFILSPFLESVVKKRMWEDAEQEEGAFFPTSTVDPEVFYLGTLALLMFLFVCLFFFSLSML